MSTSDTQNQKSHVAVKKRSAAVAKENFSADQFADDSAFCNVLA